MDRPRWVQCLASAISRSDPLELFLWNLIKDKFYVPPMPITLNNSKNRIRITIAKLISLYCEMFGTKSYIVLMCAGEQVEHILKIQKEYNNVLSCSLQWREFNFCMAIIFLEINTYNHVTCSKPL